MKRNSWMCAKHLAELTAIVQAGSISQVSANSVGAVHGVGCASPVGESVQVDKMAREAIARVEDI